MMRFSLAALGAASVLSILLIACSTETTSTGSPSSGTSSGDPAPGDDGDDGNDDAGTSDSGNGKQDSGDPNACANVTQQGSVVTGAEGGTVPTFSGGTIADGTYVVTKFEGFGPAKALVVGKTTKQTLVVSGKTWESVGEDDGKAATQKKATVSASGSKLTMTTSCPKAQTADYSFTATDDSLVVGFGFAGAAPTSGIVITYTKK